MFDLLVVGGGPTGLAAAITAVRQGLRCAVLEPRTPPIDKACGEGLMPAAVQLLDDLGIERPEGRPFVGIRYIQGGRQAAARFRQGLGMGVRRTRLHAALWRRAEQLGVELIEGRMEAVALTDDDVRVGALRARWLIAADGLRSPTARRLDLEVPRRMPPRIGLRRHFSIAPWTDHVEVHWSPRAEAYVTPVGPDLVGVALLCFRDRLAAGEGSPFDRLISGFPALQARLAGAAPASRLAGAGPFEHRLRRVVHGRVLMVGDAAGYLDPLTGEGIRIGLASAQAAVAAIRRGRPARYEAAWHALARPQLRATAALLHLARNPISRRLIVPTAGTVPALMQAVVDTLA